MKRDTMLRLGRVSNLPTVWTNAVAGATLAGGAELSLLALAALSLSLSYVAGMWLNDAFDAEIDARARAGRPIPSGAATVGQVFAGGFAMLAAGAALAFAISPGAGLIGLALAATIVLYDWVHKRTALSPVIMGATRFLAYGVGAMAAGGFTETAVWGAAGLFAYVVGLTYAARQEAYDRLGSAWPLAALAAPVALALHAALRSAAALPLALALVALLALALWLLFRRAKGDVPRAVVTMIAGIALYDGALAAALGGPALALFAVVCFALTLLLQRVAPGT